jgi:hypothetical protein
MCGQCATSKGEPLKGTEFSQMVDCGFIQEDQFHGIEIKPNIHKLNKKAYPNANWYQGDFYEQLKRAVSDGFDPAIVNMDTIITAEHIGEVSKVMLLLSDFAGDVMFVVNLITQVRSYKFKGVDYIVDKMNKNAQFVNAYNRANWSGWDKWYSYNGTGGNGGTWMGTFVFFKN